MEWKCPRRRISAMKNNPSNDPNKAYLQKIQMEDVRLRFQGLISLSTSNLAKLPQFRIGSIKKSIWCLRDKFKSETQKWILRRNRRRDLYRPMPIAAEVSERLGQGRRSNRDGDCQKACVCVCVCVCVWKKERERGKIQSADLAYNLQNKASPISFLGSRSSWHQTMLISSYIDNFEKGVVGSRANVSPRCWNEWGPDLEKEIASAGFHVWGSNFVFLESRNTSSWC